MEGPSNADFSTPFKLLLDPIVRTELRFVDKLQSVLGISKFNHAGLSYIRAAIMIADRHM
jgi:hypothetical protein